MAQTELNSLGHAAVILGQVPGKILADLLEVFGESPALSIDGVPYLDAAQMEKLGEHFKGKPHGWSNDPLLRRRRGCGPKPVSRKESPQ